MLKLNFNIKDYEPIVEFAITKEENGKKYLAKPLEFFEVPENGILISTFEINYKEQNLKDFFNIGIEVAEKIK